MKIYGINYIIIWSFKKLFYIEEEILKFEDNVKNWVKTFCQLTIGQMNTATMIPGLYRKDDVTPYMHMLTLHVSYFLCQLKEKGLLFRLFSISSIEKKIIIKLNLFIFKLKNLFIK